MMNYLKDINVVEKIVLVREDFNVPINQGQITSDLRIHAALPTLNYLIDHNATILILSHLGRPQEGIFTKEYSLQPVAKKLSELLNLEVHFLPNWPYYPTLPGKINLAENVRFLKGENNNEIALAQQMAHGFDVFVMDAFGCAHRTNASTVGVVEYVPTACAGLLLEKEIVALQRALAKPERPVLAIIGGAKASTKLSVLQQLLTKVDDLILGGGIANTFLAAQGLGVGRSLCEVNFVPQAKELIEWAKNNHKKIHLPIDAMVANECSGSAQCSLNEIKAAHEILSTEMILDIGPQTEKKYAAIVENAKTIIWNGPVGVFEFDAFAHGTQALAEAIAASHAYSLAGGGDTIAALEKFGLMSRMSYVSTGGGALIEFLEGKTLPALAALATKIH